MYCYRGDSWLNGIESASRTFYGKQGEEYSMKFFLNLYESMMEEGTKQEAVIAALGHSSTAFHPRCRGAVLVCTRTQ
jgi:hypothetical protein